MGGIRDTLEQEWLDHYFLNAAIPDVGNAGGLPAAGAVGDLQVNLFTVMPTDAGAGTIAAYTGYVAVTPARDGTGWARTGSTMENFAQLGFGVATASFGAEIIGWGVSRTVATATTPDFYGPVATVASAPFTLVDSATADLIVADAHGLVDNDRVMLIAVEGKALPTGLVETIAYHVVTGTTDTFQVSLTQGGGAVAVSTDGAGRFSKIVPQQPVDQSEPVMQANQIKITVD